MISSLCVKSTCDVENDKRRPMGGIDGCILLGNELLIESIPYTFGISLSRTANSLKDMQAYTF